MRKKPGWTLCALNPRPPASRRRAQVSPREARLQPRSRPLIQTKRKISPPRTNSACWSERWTRESRLSSSRRMTTNCTSRCSKRSTRSSTRPSRRSKPSRQGSKNVSTTSNPERAPSAALAAAPTVALPPEDTMIFPDHENENFHRNHYITFHEQARLASLLWACHLQNVPCEFFAKTQKSFDRIIQHHFYKFLFRNHQKCKKKNHLFSSFLSLISNLI